MDLVFVGDRCSDHSPSSGYDQVCSLFPRAGWMSGRELVAGRVTWHRRPAGSFAASRTLFHVFYGDCSGRRLPALLRARFPGAAIVATAHQPVSRLLHDAEATAALAASDAVVAVSRAQAAELAGLGPDVHVVPHGVWTSAFRPARPAPRRRDRVLLVGNHLRDWAATAAIVDALAAAGVRTVVVGSNVASDVLAGRPWVERAPRLSEPELAAAYDRAAALLLPVIEATASNAVLEAMAAGCPVVRTRSPSLDEYLGDRADAFEPGDAATAVALLRRYVSDPRRRAARSRALRRRAERFDWASLAPRYASTFGRVAQTASPSSIPVTLSNVVRPTQEV